MNAYKFQVSAVQAVLCYPPFLSLCIGPINKYIMYFLEPIYISICIKLFGCQTIEHFISNIAQKTFIKM